MKLAKPFCAKTTSDENIIFYLRCLKMIYDQSQKSEYYLNTFAPLHYAEDFDNVGLLVGNPDTEVKGILVTLDTLEEVVDEAISKKCNLIVSFHPIIFNGLKKLVGNTYVERVVMKAISNNIAIFCNSYRTWIIVIWGSMPKFAKF